MWEARRPARCRLRLHIDEEGVFVDNLILVRDGIFREDAVRESFTDHAVPGKKYFRRVFPISRRRSLPAERDGELASGYRKIQFRYGQDYMGYIRMNAEDSVKKALYRFIGSGRKFHSAFEDHLDDGSPIKVMLRLTEVQILPIH